MFVRWNKVTFSYLKHYTPLGLSECEICPKGFTCYSGQVMLCPKGAFCPEGTGMNASLCAPGTYNAREGISEVCSFYLSLTIK